MFNPSQFLVRTEAAKTVGGCDERVVYSQEYGLTLRLARRWPFVYVDAPVAWLPEDAPGRLSTNEGLQLQRVTKSLALFLYDNPDLPAADKRYACRRAAGRAWKYARRRGGEPALGRWMWRNLASRAALFRDAGLFVEGCCDAFWTKIFFAHILELIEINLPELSLLSSLFEKERRKRDCSSFLHHLVLCFSSVRTRDSRDEMKMQT